MPPLIWSLLIVRGRRKRRWKKKKKKKRGANEEGKGVGGRRRESEFNSFLAVASNEVRTAWSALAAIDGYLGNKEKDATLMKPHVDQFLIAVSLQLRMAYTKHMTGKSKIQYL